MPTPAGPISVNNRHELVVVTSAKSATQTLALRGRARPAGRRAAARRHRHPRRARPAGTRRLRSDLPLTASSTASPSDRVSHESQRVVAEQDLARRRPPARAAPRHSPHRPVTSVSPSPATTAPVLTPIRASSPSSCTTSRSSTADRTARRASSSFADGNPEHRHHRVTDELLHRPAVTLEHAARRLVVPVHQRPQRLGVGPLADRRRARQVAEQHRDDLAHLSRLPLGASGAPQAGQNTNVVRALAPALGADGHGASLRPRRRPLTILRTRDWIGSRPPGYARAGVHACMRPTTSSPVATGSLEQIGPRRHGRRLARPRRAPGPRRRAQGAPPLGRRRPRAAGSGSSARHPRSRGSSTRTSCGSTTSSSTAGRRCS